MKVVYEEDNHTIFYCDVNDKYVLHSPKPYDDLWSNVEWILKEEITIRKKKSSLEQLTLFDRGDYY